MEELFREIAATTALVLEAIAVVLIAFGSAQALLGIVRILGSRSDQLAARRVFLGLARWLVLALEFTLAADIVLTTITPNWQDIGQLAAIAAIRTFLN